MARTVTGGRYKIPRHLAILDSLLVDLDARKYEGLIVSMPPRHGKSMLVSQYFPAWYSIWNPDHRIIFLSHNASFARTWGRKARDVVKAYGDQFGVHVRQDSHAADHWNVLHHDGGMDTTGVGGSLTGRGADLIIVDDLIKGHKEALSKTFRDSAWELWQSCVETRAEPGCVFVVVGTRWHEDDVIGRLKREIKGDRRKGWKVLNLRAISDGKKDPLGRAEGEALWPERYPAERLLALQNRWDHDEARLGPYWWSALYQQNPTPREGGLFKRTWFRYYKHDDEFFHLGVGDTAKKVPKRRCWKFVTVDLAVSTKTTADYFALGLWYVTPDRDLMLHDVIHERIEGPDQPGVIERVWKEHRPAFVAIESNQYQLSLVQTMLRKGCPVREVHSDQDKLARAQLAATRYSAGTVYLRSGAPWLQVTEDELLVFPNGKNDDLVDINSMAAHELAACAMPTVS